MAQFKNSLVPLLESELDILVRTAYGEAANQGVMGQRAVAAVVMNRVKSKRYPRDTMISKACLRHLQFSCWNADDGLRRRMYGLLEDRAIYQKLRRACLDVLLGNVADPTGGATLYHTIKRPVWAKSWPPKWAKSKRTTKLCVIKDHIFYKE